MVLTADPKKTRLGILGVLLLAIAAGMLIDRFDLIDFRPGFSEFAVLAADGGAGAQPAGTTPTSAKLSTADQSTVAIVQSKRARAEEITYEEIRAMVAEAVDLAGGFDGAIKEGQTVVIKPNLVTPIDYTLPNWKGRPLATEVNGNTTDWRVTKAIVELVRRYNKKGKVYVMEGSAFPTRDVMKHLKYTPEYIPGVTEFIAIEEDSGPWMDFYSPHLVGVSPKKRMLHEKYFLNKKYKEADVLISVPTLKTHWSALVSGSIKNVGIGATPANVYGTADGNPNRGSAINHQDDRFNQWIHDWYLCRPIDFTIVDALQGIQNGPTPCYEMTRTTDIKQDQMNMRLIMASKDAVASDTISSLVMGWDPSCINYLNYLARDGAGRMDTARIRVAGKRVDEVRKPFATKTSGPVTPVKVNDLSPPLVTVRKAAIKGDTLAVTLAADADTVKVEAYLDGKYAGTAAAKSFANCTIRIDGLERTTQASYITLCAYDRFLNCSRTILQIIQGKVTVVDDGDYIARRAETAPEIDGSGNDACWERAAWKSIACSWDYFLQPAPGYPAPEDFSGRYKIVWTPERLYYLIEIADDKLSDTHPDPLANYWDDDCVELFLDEDRSGGDHKNNYNAFAYHVGLDYTAVDLTDAGDFVPGIFTDHVKAVRTTNGTTHTWELAVDVYSDKYAHGSTANKPVALYAGKAMGFAVAYCDSDSFKRDNFIGSIPLPWGEDLAWRDAGVFGTLTLVE